MMRAGRKYQTLDGDFRSLDRQEQRQLNSLLSNQDISELSPVLRCLYELWLDNKTIKTFPIKAGKTDLAEILVAQAEIDKNLGETSA